MFGKYAIEVFKKNESYLQNQANDFIHKNFAEMYSIDIPFNYGKMCYYGISNIFKQDKEKALIYFKKGYQISKEKIIFGTKY